MNKKNLNNNYLVLVAIIVISTIILLASNVVLTLSFKLLNSLNGMKFETITLNVSDLFNFQFQYKTYYLITLIIILIADIRAIYSIKKNFKNINNGQKGTNEFTTLKELKEQYKAVPEKTDTYKGNGGVIISRYKNKVFIDDSPVNNLIIGTTRSGKGETFVFPTIDIYSRAENKPSMIINDPKGELASASYETLKKRGYEIEILNLLEPNKSMSYNPLQLIINAYKNKEFSTAQLLCNTLTFSLYDDANAKDKFWQISAQSLVNALILAITKDCIDNNEEEKITLYTIANFLAEKGAKVDKDGKNELDKFFENRDSADIAKMQYATSNFAKGVTRSGIFSTAMAKLQIFTFDEIAKMTSKNSYDLEKIGFDKKPVVIFMVTPDFDSSFHVIASIFVRQTYYIAARKASLSQKGKCDREIVYLLDEFGNMPAIEGFANIITVCLGRNIKFNLIIQAYSQLKKLYGEDRDTIVGNCGNQIYILTSEKSTAKDFSEMLGYRTIVNSSISGKSLLGKSTTKSIDRRELLTKDELMSLREGESVVIRVIKRKDKKGNKINPRPIFNTEKTTLKFRNEYLNEDFDTNKSIINLKIEGKHINTDLKNLIFKPIKKEIEEESKEENKENKGIRELLEQIDEFKRNDKFKISKIIKMHEDYSDIDIENSSDLDIKELLVEMEELFSEEQRKVLIEILERR